MASAALAMASTLFIAILAFIPGAGAAAVSQEPEAAQDPREVFDSPQDDEAAEVAIIDRDAQESTPVSFGMRNEGEAATRASLDRSERMESTSRGHRVKSNAKSQNGGLQGFGTGASAGMPYPDLEVFGRADTAAELTRASISESNKMIDQIERAEVAETKRSVYRSLTRLRGAATAAFDGVARSQVGNIDQYAADNRFLDKNSVRHLAKEEADTEKWAFPHAEEVSLSATKSNMDILDLVDGPKADATHDASLLAHKPAGNFWGTFAAKEAESNALDAAKGHASWRLVRDLLTGSD